MSKLSRLGDGLVAVGVPVCVFNLGCAYAAGEPLRWSTALVAAVALLEVGFLAGRRAWRGH